MSRSKRIGRAYDTDVTKGHRAAGANELRAKCGMPPIGAYAGACLCLSCEEEFDSPDRRHIRICDRCKTSEDWTSGGTQDEALVFIPIEEINCE